MSDEKIKRVRELLADGRIRIPTQQDMCEQRRLLAALADDLEAARAEIERLRDRAEQSRDFASDVGMALLGEEPEEVEEQMTLLALAKQVRRDRNEATKRAEKAEAELERLRAYVHGVEAAMDAVKVERNTALDRAEKAERERDEAVAKAGRFETMNLNEHRSHNAAREAWKRRKAELESRLADLERWRPELIPLAAVGRVAEGRAERVLAVTDLVDDLGTVVVEAGEIITVKRLAARNQVKVCDESGGGTIGFVVATQRVLKMPLPEPPKEAR